MRFPGKERLPEGFTSPTELPQTETQAKEWQAVNRSWWENHPMRYDFMQGENPYPEFTKEFYTEIDWRFFSNAREFMPWNTIPFDALIDFDALKAKDVLEIGVGNGSHAQLLAEHARSFTGIDLTDFAVQSTAKRMRCFGLDARILRMDAENMEFEDNSFDFIWSWGVIHHSSNTQRVLKEMNRVLRPGGKAITMVYHRSFWYYYVLGGLFNGILKGQLFRSKSLHQVTQQMIDGGIARYYSIPEWKNLISEFFDVEEVSIYGQKADMFPLPGGKLKAGLMACVPNAFSRLFTNKLQMGYFLVSKMRKPDNRQSA
jgi:ubiquinone/menaquinone biosynthesis C-methylase UbiE